jgi:hypothetical protein
MQGKPQPVQLQAQTVEAQAEPSLLDQIAAAQSEPMRSPGILAEIAAKPQADPERRYNGLRIAELAHMEQVTLERKLPCWACNQFPCIGHVRGHKTEYYIEWRESK